MWLNCEVTDHVCHASCIDGPCVQGAESLRQWLSCVGRIEPMTEAEVPEWAVVNGAAGAADNGAATADGLPGEEAGGGDGGGKRPPSAGA